MTYKRILAPIDGSPAALAGLRAAARLAKEQGSRLQLLHVVDLHSIVEHAGRFSRVLSDLRREAGRSIARRAETVAHKEGVRPEVVLLESLSGTAADAIVRQASRLRADLIVMGTHGRRGLRRVLLGSDAEEVLRRSKVPVMLVRARTNARPARRRTG